MILKFVSTAAHHATDRPAHYPEPAVRPLFETAQPLVTSKGIHQNQLPSASKSRVLRS